MVNGLDFRFQLVLKVRAGNLRWPASLLRIVNCNVFQHPSGHLARALWSLFDGIWVSSRVVGEGGADWER